MIPACLEGRPMNETVTRVTAEFEVEGDDGSIEIVTEQTTFLIHKVDGFEAPQKQDWFLNGEDLIRDQSDHNIFTNALTKKKFRRVL
jgi:hypothetical protein